MFHPIETGWNGKTFDVRNSHSTPTQTQNVPESPRDGKIQEAERTKNAPATEVVPLARALPQSLFLSFLQEKSAVSGGVQRNTFVQ